MHCSVQIITCICISIEASQDALMDTRFKPHTYKCHLTLETIHKHRFKKQTRSTGKGVDCASLQNIVFVFVSGCFNLSFCFLGLQTNSQALRPGVSNRLELTGLPQIQQCNKHPLGINIGCISPTCVRSLPKAQTFLCSS